MTHEQMASIAANLGWAIVVYAGGGFWAHAIPEDAISSKDAIPESAAVYDTVDQALSALAERLTDEDMRE